MKAAFRLAMAASMSTSLESDQNINLGANNKGKFQKFPTRDEINVKFAATVDKIQKIDEKISNTMEQVSTGKFTAEKVRDVCWPTMFEYAHNSLLVQAEVMSNMKDIMTMLVDVNQRLENQDRKMSKELKDIKKAASEQAVPSYATVTKLSVNSQPNSINPDSAHQYTLLNKIDIQRKREKEADRCSKEVVLNVKRMSGTDLANSNEIEKKSTVIQCLQKANPDITADKVKSYRPIEKHHDRALIVEFFHRKEVDDLLRKANEAKIEYKDLRPSRTRGQLEEIRAKKEQRDRLIEEARQRGDPPPDRTRPNRPTKTFFHPKPVIPVVGPEFPSLLGASATATPHTE